LRGWSGANTTLKEISYIHAEGYAAGEKHAPIALIDETVAARCRRLLARPLGRRRRERQPGPRRSPLGAASAPPSDLGPVFYGG
jgi:hypothetical protein